MRNGDASNLCVKTVISFTASNYKFSKNYF